MHGPASVLTSSANCPLPSLSPTQVLVKASYASLNPCDFKFRRLSLPYPSLTSSVADFLFPKPKIPALDVSGVVVAVGSSVKTLNVGTRVAATQPILHTRWGTLAQFSAVEEGHAAVVPDGVGLRDAAAVALVGLTTVQAFENVQQREGGRALVHAGSGGLGSFAVQWAVKVLGMEVTATASSRNAEMLKGLGAKKPMDYDAPEGEGWDDGRPGYDVVFDPMSYMYEDRALRGDAVLADDGHYVNIASSGWAVGEEGMEDANGIGSYLNLAYYGARRLAGLGGVRYSFVAVIPSGEQLSRVLAEVEKGTVKAVIDSEVRRSERDVDSPLPNSDAISNTRARSQFELKDARAAYEHLETGRARGKVVVRIPHGDEAAAGRANPGPPGADGARETLFNVGLHCEGCANGVKGVLYKVGGLCKSEFMRRRSSLLRTHTSFFARHSWARAS